MNNILKICVFILICNPMAHSMTLVSSGEQVPAPENRSQEVVTSEVTKLLDFCFNDIPFNFSQIFNNPRIWQEKINPAQQQFLNTMTRKIQDFITLKGQYSDITLAGQMLTEQIRYITMLVNDLPMMAFFLQDFEARKSMIQRYTYSNFARVNEAGMVVDVLARKMLEVFNHLKATMPEAYKQYIN